MKLKIWGKTLLSIYNCLFKLVGEIDKIVIDFAIKGGVNYGFDSSLYNMQKIIDLTERKITLINVKVLVEEILNDLDDTSCKILTLKFIDKMPNDLVINVLGLKRRTFYRKFNYSLDSFAKKLLNTGYDEKKLLKLIREENWIYEVFKDFCERENQEQLVTQISEHSIINLINRSAKKAKKMPSQAKKMSS